MSQTINGRIIKGLGGLYEILSDDSKTLTCRARGVLRHKDMTPTVGDLVCVRADGDGMFIDSICERKNCLIRPPLSNIDVMFITFAATKPEPSLLNIDKMCAICEHNSIEPVIVVTKSDIDTEKAAQYCNIYKKAGYHAFSLSSVDGSGMEEFAEFTNKLLPGKCAAFAGASGVGKSTCMNFLFPSLSLKTSDISRKIERGRHTTRHVELYPVTIGSKTALLADTPGFGLLDFVHFDFFEFENLAACFSEFYDYIGECKYTKCTHKKEEGCKIVEAVKRGEISKSRHDSYCAIYDEFKNKKYK
ncbi:MAG: ribosome small subunit-dependent GTPase A [Clostridia bacterium]|nr:ribosome small subunit-dependent GTPase A [Clostridia bacterium]